MGGIGGAPFVGKTGFTAFSHHVADVRASYSSCDFTGHTVTLRLTLAAHPLCTYSLPVSRMAMY